MTYRKAQDTQTAFQNEAEMSLLMKEAQQGNGRSYARLLNQLCLLLRRYLENAYRRFGRSDVGNTEDVLQEILIAIHTKRHTFDGEQLFLPWVYSIARYKMIDHFRKNKFFLKNSVPLDDELENLESLMSLPSSDGIDVLALCEALPEKQRLVLTLTKMEGLSLAEVSNRTGYSVSDVKVTVHRAIKALQEIVKEAENADR